MMSKGSVRKTSVVNNDLSARAIENQVEEMVRFATSTDSMNLRAFERALLVHLFALGRLLVARFIAARQAQIEPALEGARWLRARNLATVFGVVRYHRMYVAGDDGHGHAPLDRALGVTADLVSANLLAVSTLLATQMPYDAVCEVLRLFVGYVPSAKTIKHAVLGFGGVAQRWLTDVAPIPEGDGEVLIAMFDSKGTPTATDEELRKRRGRRTKRKKAPSPRHRGRNRRAQWAPKRRRKKGDKSKNAKLCTVVVMFTLRRRGDLLLGPLNKRVYASFGPKELAFQWAARQAEKRGFGKDSGRTIQVVTDGDEDLATYVERHFPEEAIHTLDIYHALEYVWQAGMSLHGEGTEALNRWYAEARSLVFEGKVASLLGEFEDALASIPRYGPGNKTRRKRLQDALGYLGERVAMMDYKVLKELDLEIGSGAVEGAVNHLVGQRFDHGGMRWIRERAQALLQLRCIHQNGEWEAFIDWALTQLTRPTDEHPVPRILRTAPAPLPQLARAA